jgi:hypothetical protein
LHLSQELRWAVVNVHDLSFKGELNEDVIVFPYEMEEAASQGGWSDDELVRRTANQLEGEAEAIC